MNEFDLLKFINSGKFGKSSLPSIIGAIYYIWPAETNAVKADLNGDTFSTRTSLNRNASPGSKPKFDTNTNVKTDNPGTPVFFLSNSEKSFDLFIDFLKNKFPGRPIIDKASPEIDKELSGYLKGRIREMRLEPVCLRGTDFEKKIWETARKIPYGEVASYKELAENAGHPNAFRAAGTALGNNSLMLIVPCHRVIRSNGEIGFFGGGEEIKLRLLDLEQPQFAE